MAFSRAVKIFRTLVQDAEKYHEQPGDAAALARDAEIKAQKHHSALGRVWNELSTFARLLNAWARGRYRQAPWKSIAFIIGAMLYFVDPFDAIPDFIPVLGYVDDAFIIALTMRAVRKDVEKFRDWEGMTPA